MARIVSYTDYRDYFKTIATGIKLLCPNKVTPQFYEFEAHFKGNSLKYPAMILSPPECSPFDPQADNEMKKFSGELAILGQVTKESAANRHATLAELETIVEQIIAKMKADHQNYNLGTARPFAMLPMDQMKYSQIGPENEDLLFGYNFEFIFYNPNRFSIDDNYWW